MEDPILNCFKSGDIWLTSPAKKEMWPDLPIVNLSILKISNRFENFLGVERQQSKHLGELNTPLSYTASAHHESSWLVTKSGMSIQFTRHDAMVTV